MYTAHQLQTCCGGSMVQNSEACQPTKSLQKSPGICSETQAVYAQQLSWKQDESSTWLRH